MIALSIETMDLHEWNLSPHPLSSITTVILIVIITIITVTILLGARDIPSYWTVQSFLSIIKPKKKIYIQKDKKGKWEQPELVYIYDELMNELA